MDAKKVLEVLREIEESADCCPGLYPKHWMGCKLAALIAEAEAEAQAEAKCETDSDLIRWLEKSMGVVEFQLLDGWTCSVKGWVESGKPFKRTGDTWREAILAAMRAEKEEDLK